MRRALAINEASKSASAEHPHSRIVGNNYISLLQGLGRTEDEIKASLGDLFV